MNQRNYQKELDEVLQSMTERKTLLLHCCCAPCSSYTLEYLTRFFDITIFFYNPNITSEKEYQKRKEELIRFLNAYPFEYKPTVLEAPYDPERFIEMAKGYENCEERGKRCHLCYELRLEQTAIQAVRHGMDYFCTTLSISPYKDAEVLMECGEKLAEKYSIVYLPSDFKKKNGYKRSIELSKEYTLYRQNFCGCIYSQRKAEENEKK